MMQYSEQISPNIHWLGVNDRRKELFENLWPLPYGVTYNSYLVVDEQTALIDTIESGSDNSYIERIESLLDGKELNYMVVNHMELDHSGEIETIIRRYPSVKIVGNSNTFKMLTAYFGDHSSNFMEVKNGDTISLGEKTLQFFLTPWVHWPETMMTYEQSQGILFSGDAFGTFGTVDGSIIDNKIEVEQYESEMRRYYSNIVGKYSNMVQKAFAKLAGLTINTICSLHGPTWTKNATKVLALYDKWSRQEGDDAVVVIYASMYNSTARMADYIANAISKEGVSDVKVFDVSKTHISYLISEIWRAKYIVLGSCAYNSEMFPMMEHLCTELKHASIKNKELALFGSYSWNGGGVKNLVKFAEEIKLPQIADAVEMYGRPDASKYDKCDEFAKAIAAKVLNK